MTSGARASKAKQAYRPFEMGRDALPAAIGLFAGFLIGLVVTTLVLLLLFEGLWPLIILAIPFILIQLLVQEGILGLWRLIFGRRRDDEVDSNEEVRQAFEVDAAPEAPTFLRVHSINIGMAAGAGIAALSFGIRQLTGLT